MKKSGLVNLESGKAASGASEAKAAPARAAGSVASLSSRRAGAAAPTVIGVLASLGPGGEVCVDLPSEARQAVPARTAVPLSPAHVGRDVVVVMPVRGRAGSARNAQAVEPVILGVLLAPAEVIAPAAPHAPPPVASVDGERVEIRGEKEVVLSCGKASIVLSQDGKIAIRGARLLSAASGLHRIRGGAVQIN